jgi:hypothetical protein
LGVVDVSLDGLVDGVGQAEEGCVELVTLSVIAFAVRENDAVWDIFLVVVKCVSRSV